MKLYRVSVYFAHGISAWHGKLDERDVVFRIETPWLCVARWFARSNLGNQGRLSYVIQDADKVVDEFEPSAA